MLICIKLSIIHITAGGETRTPPTLRNLKFPNVTTVRATNENTGNFVIYEAISGALYSARICGLYLYHMSLANEGI